MLRSFGRTRQRNAIIIPAAYILSRFIDANGVWAAFVVAEFVTAIYAYITYKKNTKIESK